MGLFDGLSAQDRAQMYGLGLLNFGSGILQGNQPGAGFMGALGSGAGAASNAMMAVPQMQQQQQLRQLQGMKIQSDIQKAQDEAKQREAWQRMFSNPNAAPQQIAQTGDVALPGVTQVPTPGAPQALPQQSPFGQIPPGMLPFIAQMGPEKGSAFMARLLGNKPTSVQEFEFAKENGFKGTFEDYRRSSMAENRPAAPIQNFERRQQLVKQYGETSPEVRTFDNYVRSLPYLNTGPQFVQPGVAGAPGPANVIQRGLNPGEEPTVRGAQSRESAAGTVAGTQQATAAVNLPQTIAQGEEAVKLIDDLVKHPGMKDVVGMPESASGVWRSVTGSAIPGTEAANFTARLEQLQGKQFLQAYETLKGGGQITEVEGAKAQDAISRMTKTGQTEAEFKKAADDFKAIIQGGINRAKMKAGVKTAPSGASGGWSIKREE